MSDIPYEMRRYGHYGYVPRPTPLPLRKRTFEEKMQKFRELGEEGDPEETIENEFADLFNKAFEMKDRNEKNLAEAKKAYKSGLEAYLRKVRNEGKKQLKELHIETKLVYDC